MSSKTSNLYEDFRNNSYKYFIHAFRYNKLDIQTLREKVDWKMDMALKTILKATNSFHRFKKRKCIVGTTLHRLKTN